MPVSGNVAPDNPDLARFGLSPAARKHELPVRQVDGGESSPIRAFGAQVQPVIVIGHARKVTNAIELRLQPQLDTQSPLGRGSSHAPNEPVSLQRRSTVVTFLLMHPVGTDRLVPHPRFELRLKPQLDTPSPLGRGSNHAPNEPVRTMIVIVSSLLTFDS